MDVEVVLSLVPYLVFSIITSSYSWQYVYVFEIDAPATKSLMSGTYIIFKNFSTQATVWMKNTPQGENL